MYPRYAISKETGKLVVIDRAEDFSPKFHEWPKEEKVEVPAVEEAEETPATDEKAPETTEGAEDSLVEGATDEKARFEELKEIGFRNLSGDDRKEYSRLKKIYG